MWQLVTLECGGFPSITRDCWLFPATQMRHGMWEGSRVRAIWLRTPGAPRATAIGTAPTEERATMPTFEFDEQERLALGSDSV
jgi:hypothetical protein